MNKQLLFGWFTSTRRDRASMASCFDTGIFRTKFPLSIMELMKDNNFMSDTVEEAKNKSTMMQTSEAEGQQQPIKGPNNMPDVSNKGQKSSRLHTPKGTPKKSGEVEERKFSIGIGGSTLASLPTNSQPNPTLFFGNSQAGPNHGIGFDRRPIVNEPDSVSRRLNFGSMAGTDRVYQQPATTTGQFGFKSQAPSFYGVPSDLNQATNYFQGQTGFTQLAPSFSSNHQPIDLAPMPRSPRRSISRIDHRIDVDPAFERPPVNSRSNHAYYDADYQVPSQDFRHEGNPWQPDDREPSRPPQYHHRHYGPSRSLLPQYHPRQSLGGGVIERWWNMFLTNRASSCLQVTMMSLWILARTLDILIFFGILLILIMTVFPSRLQATSYFIPSRWLQSRLMWGVYVAVLMVVRVLTFMTTMFLTDFRSIMGV